MSHIPWTMLKDALRHPNKVERYDVDLGEERTAESDAIATLGLRVTILDKSTGVFTLTFVFRDDSTMNLASTEVLNGDILDFEFAALKVINTEQAGVTIKLLVDKRI